MNRLVKLYHQLGSPPTFYRITGKWLPWLFWAGVLLMLWGLYDGLFVAPIDYQQRESFKISYIHVPAAWISMFIYLVMGISGFMALVWRMKVAEAILIASAPIGAIFTLLALVTGSLWGKPMWGTWWDWDARMTSELILLFLYIGVMATYNAYDDPRKGARVAALVAVIGLVNLPIIHFSVEWWSTIHQASTVSLFGKQHIPWSMLRGWLLMAIGTKLYYGYSVLKRARLLLLETEKHTAWVQKVIEQECQNA